jgi:hypothetical protein
MVPTRLESPLDVIQRAELSTKTRHKKRDDSTNAIFSRSSRISRLSRLFFNATDDTFDHNRNFLTNISI